MRFGCLALAGLLFIGSAFAAGKIVPRFTAYFTPAFTDVAYQKVAAEKVRKAWHAPAGAPVGKKTVLIAEIATDGKLSGLRENMLTGFKPWDDAAVAAVKAAAPFPPLPKSWTFPTMEVHFHFEAAAK
ncbi:MAG TPA: TonB C-terminal domain-containing protein [Candidatus Polarisedimenticolaceae bacterium]|nr:TonB C-terminal domain-containing protein [Candidatus Polarisedimenticolaceae bacterium]